MSHTLPFLTNDTGISCNCSNQMLGNRSNVAFSEAVNPLFFKNEFHCPLVFVDGMCFCQSYATGRIC